MFYCEVYETTKNIYFLEYLWTAASVREITINSPSRLLLLLIFMLFYLEYLEKIELQK